MDIPAHEMDDDLRLAFWQVKWDAAERLKRVGFLVFVGAGLVGASLFLGQQGVWVALVVGVVVASAGVVSSGSSDPDWKPPEPKLELVDEKYRIKATGKDGIDAVALIAVFREQEDRRAQRLVIWIGTAFGIVSIALGFYREEILATVISAALAIFFVAWAMKIKQIQLKGLGIEVGSSNVAGKQK